MKQIPLANGKSFAIIDDEDFELASKYRWTRLPTNNGNKEYVQTSTTPRITLHRLLMGFPDKHLVVDHINHNGLDNRRCNLRVITKKQNQGNRRSARNSSSKFLGVSKNKRSGKFTAQIGLGNKKVVCIGRFDNEIDAAMAYNEKAKIVHGEFANLNIIP